MQLKIARLCLDCDEVHQSEHCPVCASEAFGYLTRWVPSPERRMRPRATTSPAADAYRELISPKAGAKIDGSNIEVKWDPYPDAAYYKFSIHADSSSGAQTEYDFINKRVDGTSYVLEKPLSPGSYTCQVVAYNGNDIKLSESADDIKFTVGK